MAILPKDQEKANNHRYFYKTGIYLVERQSGGGKSHAKEFQ